MSGGSGIPPHSSTRDPAAPSPSVVAPGCPAHRNEPENQSDDEKDEPDDPQEVDAEYEAEYCEDCAEGDHARCSTRGASSHTCLGRSWRYRPASPDRGDAPRAP